MAASVSLVTVWLNLASEPSISQSFPSMSKLEVNTKRPGEARLNANGRTRLIRKPAKARTFALSLPICTRAQIDWLELYAGELVLVRDDRGRKVWCTYFDAPIDEAQVNDQGERLGDVTLALVEITHSEVV